MSKEELRAEIRVQGTASAFVSGPRDPIGVKCAVRELSTRGCRIVSSGIRNLPDLVWLTPEGFKKPISAMIVWRLGKMAGLSFEHTADAETRMRFKNLREARRREDKKLSQEPPPPPKSHLSYRERLKHWQSDLLP